MSVSKNHPVAYTFIVHSEPFLAFILTGEEGGEWQGRLMRMNHKHFNGV